MFVGLTTIGSAAQRVAFRPGAGLTLRADSSGPTCAVAAAFAARVNSTADATARRRGARRTNISGSWGDDGATGPARVPTARPDPNGHCVAPFRGRPAS